MSDIQKYDQMFDYLSAPSLPVSPEAAVVFGRQDPLVAYKLGDLIIPGLVEIAVISGGIGKDSGDLLEHGFKSEAGYLRAEAVGDSIRRNYSLPSIVLDEKATNGGENARNSIDILLAAGHSLDSTTAVVHATSARRLAETLKFEAAKKVGHPIKVHVAPSKYSFNSSSEADQDEAAQELLRIADWPTKGQLGIQPDVPEKLVDFARDKHGTSPAPVAPWQSAILRRLPPKLRYKAIRFAANNGRK